MSTSMLALGAGSGTFLTLWRPRCRSPVRRASASGGHVRRPPDATLGRIRPVVQLAGGLHIDHTFERRRSSRVAQGCPCRPLGATLTASVAPVDVSLSPGHPIMPMSGCTPVPPPP